MACLLRGATDLQAIARTAVDASPLTDVQVGTTACLGQCDGAPAIAVNDQIYTEASAQRIVSLLESLANGRTLRRQRYAAPDTAYVCDPYDGAPTYDALRRLVHGGDSAAVIEALKASGLRGMGGAGFPTGVKWELVQQAPGDTKYVICNADESEPGTFKDRVILQTLPDLVLEGMALAAVTVGAGKAIIYIRHEYARQRDVLLKTLRQRQDEGVLGPYMMGSVAPRGLRDFREPRRLHLRRGNRPPRSPGGQARRAAPQAALSGHPRAVRRPHADEQRRDLRHGARHRAQRRRVVGRTR